MNIGEVLAEINSFLDSISCDNHDESYLWMKMRNFFRDLQNRGIIFEITSELFMKIEKIRKNPVYSKYLNDDMLVCVFPSLKLSVLKDNPASNTKSLVKIHPPTLKSSNTPRISYKKLLVENETQQNIPTLIQNSKVKKEQTLSKGLQDHMKSPFESIPSLQLAFTARDSLNCQNAKKDIPIGTRIKNETDALAYVASVDDETDYLKFHYGTMSENDPYTFDVKERLLRNGDFQTISKRGVLTARFAGQSEFATIEEFVTSKVNFNIIRNMKFFSQFRLNKCFRYWNKMTIKRYFMRRLESFSDTCWATKAKFPNINHRFRRDLFQINELSLFPVRNNSELEFLDIMNDFGIASRIFSDTLYDVSEKISISLTEFAAELNQKYLDLVSPESRNFLDMEKIPSELFSVHKVPYKKSLSITEAKSLKENHNLMIRKAYSNLSAITSFFSVCEKTILSFFSEILYQKFLDFSRLFIDNSHFVRLRVVLDYENGDLVFHPSIEQLKSFMNSYVDNILSSISSFVKPMSLNPDMKSKANPSSSSSMSIRDHIMNKSMFPIELNKYFKIIEDSYQDALDTYNSYRPSSLATQELMSNWESIKLNESDPTHYINNLTKLTSLQSNIVSLKSGYFHLSIALDCRSLRTGLLDFLKRAIDENNTILFRNFETICNDIVNEYDYLISTLVSPDDTLESKSLFNEHINEAKKKAPILEEKMQTVNMIYNRALNCANLLVPVLLISLKQMKLASTRFDEAILLATRAMEDSRSKTIQELIALQLNLEDQLSMLDRQIKGQFSVLVTNISSETAINDLTDALHKTDSLIEGINTFKLTAERLKFTNFDFSHITRIRNELEQNLSNWRVYSQFMQEIGKFTEASILDVDMRALLVFLNSYNEREMRSVHHPLFDRMANHFALLFQYHPFFSILSKINLDYNHWLGIFNIIDMNVDNIRKLPLRKLLSPTILANLEQIRVYILNLQQRADLSATFENMIISMKSLVFTLHNSKLTDSYIIAFPSLYNTLSTCNSFYIYLQSLSNSPFYSSIEKQVLYWKDKLNQIIQIITQLTEFQKQYVCISVFTSSLYKPYHYPCEFQSFSFIKDWFIRFIGQLKDDPHLLSLTSKADPTKVFDIKKSNISNSVFKGMKTTNFEDLVNNELVFEPVASKMNSDSTEEDLVSNDLNQPIYKGGQILFNGELLLKCIDQATFRSNIIIKNSGHLINLQRQKCPRLYFCSDEDCIRVILGCLNSKFMNNDLLPVFPHLSRFQISSSPDNDTIIGAITVTNETYPFSTDIDYTNMSFSEIIERVDKELKKSIRSSIIDAYSAREFTEFNQWLLRYPTQSLLIAESMYYEGLVRQRLLKTEEVLSLESIIKSTKEFIQSAASFLNNSVTKSIGISSLIALKLRHLEILNELNQNIPNINSESSIWKKHMFHFINGDSGADQVFINIGPISFKYGYELISNPSLFFLSNQEEETGLSLASCLIKSEFCVCSQIGGIRGLIKPFADFCGLPYFELPCSMVSSIITGSMTIPSIIQLKNVDFVPVSFPNFYGALEMQSRVFKSEDHFKEIRIDQWNSLIHIDSETIPSWLQQKLRPIHVNPMDKNDIKKMMFGIRPLSDMNVDSFHLKAITFFNFEEILFRTGQRTPDYTKFPLYFDAPEFFMTNQVIISKDFTEYELPNSLIEKINILFSLIDKLDAFSPHSHNPDFPCIPYSSPIKLVVPNYRIGLFFVLASLKDNIKNSQYQLEKYDEKRIFLNLYAYRPLSFVFYCDMNEESLDSIIVPEEDMYSTMKIMLKQNDLAPHYESIEPYSSLYIKNADLHPNFLFSKLTEKLSLLRYCIHNGAIFPPSELAEAVYSDDLLRIKVSPEIQHQISLNNQIPIIIKGKISQKKREFVKKFILGHSKADDIVLFSSPYNEKLNDSVFKYISQISRGIYGPSDGKTVFVCIFDYQYANRQIKDFVYSMCFYRSLYDYKKYQYLHVDRVQLIITTTQQDDFEYLPFPYYTIYLDEPYTLNYQDITNDLISFDLIDCISKYIETKSLFYLGKEFIKNSQSILSKSELYARLSLYFDEEIFDTIAKIENISIDQIRKTIHQNNLCDISIHDSYFLSKVKELISLNMSAIIVADDVSVLKHISNVSYIILDSSFKTQLFSALVKVSHSRTRSIIIMDLNYLNHSEVFDVLDLFLYNSDSIEYQTYFENADISIIKHYLDPYGSNNSILKMIQNYLSFFVVCNSVQFDNNIPDVFKKKMIHVKRFICNDLRDQKTDVMDSIDAFLPYTGLDRGTFSLRSQFYYSKFKNQSEFIINSLHKSLEFLSQLLNLKPKIENSNGIVLSSSAESDMKEKFTQLGTKIQQFSKRSSEFNEQINVKMNSLQVLQAKIAVQAPNELGKEVASISTYPLEDQVSQINDWLSKKDQFSVYATVFKELFHFSTISNFTETTINSSYCRLVASLRQFSLSEHSVNSISKLQKYGLSSDSSPEAPLQQLFRMGESNLISSIPFVNSILSWLLIIIKFFQWQEESTQISAELTQLQSRNSTNLEQIELMKKERAEISETLKANSGGPECPEWLVKAWKKDENDTKKLFEQMEEGARVLLKIADSANETDKMIKIYSVVFTAFENGFCSVPYKKRRQILQSLDLNSLLSPFELITNLLDMELFFPFSKPMHLFTSLSYSYTDEAKLSNITNSFCNVNVFDQFIAGSILPKSYKFLISEDPFIGDTYALPIKVYFDPLDIVYQTVISINSHIEFDFSSNPDLFDHISQCFLSGSQILIRVDSIHSLDRFESIVTHFHLHYKLSQSIYYNEEVCPVSSSIQIIAVSAFRFENRPNVIMVDMDVPNLHETIWYPLITVFNVNSQIENLCISLLSTVFSKTIELMNGLRKISEFAEGTWSDIFENPQKQYSIRSIIDQMINNSKTRLNSVVSLKMLVKESNEHPQAIYRYQAFTEQCKNLITSMPFYHHKYVFQTINSIQEFSKLRSYSPLAPNTTVNSFQEIVMSYICLLPANERMLFLTSFEMNHLKPIVPPQSLLFESSFPKLNERPIGPLIPQLIGHISARFINLPRSFFSFSSPDSIPISPNRPIVLEVHDLISLDTYSRAMGQYFASRNLVLLTIGSFSNQTLINHKIIQNIFINCREKDAKLLIIFDELMPSFVFPAIQFYSSSTGFNSYYILVNSTFAKGLPVIPNAIYINVSKPCSLFGCNKLLNMVPYYKRLTLKSERPLLLLLMLLSHRTDFPVRFHHILPLVMLTKELWIKSQFTSIHYRDLWNYTIGTLLKTMTNSDIVQNSYLEIFKFFFKDSSPSIPYSSRSDYDNEVIFSVEIPPTAVEVGMLMTYGEPFEIISKGDTFELSNKAIYLGRYENAQEYLTDTTLINARCTDTELTINGSNHPILSVFNEPNASISFNIEIPIVSGNTIIAKAKARFNGNMQQLAMSSVFIQLC